MVGGGGQWKEGVSSKSGKRWHSGRRAQAVMGQWDKAVGGACSQWGGGGSVKTGGQCEEGGSSNKVQAVGNIDQWEGGAVGGEWGS